ESPRQYPGNHEPDQRRDQEATMVERGGDADPWPEQRRVPSFGPRSVMWCHCRGSVITMPFVAPPPTAAWEHHGARSGFEVADFHLLDDGVRIEGCTTAIEDGQTWAVDYVITLDTTWTTHRARISGRSASGLRS